MSDDSDSDSNGELPPEETLIHGRARRSTAGNRMNILIQAIAEQDVQEDLLDDEEEDQKDYVAEDDGGDIDLESSDESDDEGPPKEGEEEKLEGEKEIQKQERVEAKKKRRRAEELLKIAPPRKRVKLTDDLTTNDTSTTSTPTASRPRKKSERTSWLPAPEDAPVRQSLRNATMINKEQTEVRLRETQKRSERAHALLRIAAEKKAANAGPVLTQADRIARALEIEKENSKTLNRWVQVEDERRAAQKRKMDALRNRKIEGPTVRYWSGSVIWEGEKIHVNRVHQPKIELDESTDDKAAAAKQASETGDKSDEAQKIAVQLQDPLRPFVHPEAASVAAESDHPPAGIATSSDAVAATPADPTDPSKHMPDGGVEQAGDQMQPHTSEPRSGKQSETSPDKTNPDTSISDTLNKSSVSSGPGHDAAPAVSTPQPASFLDGVHYWALQSPAPQEEKRKKVSTPDQLYPTTNAQTSASTHTLKDTISGSASEQEQLQPGQQSSVTTTKSDHDTDEKLQATVAIDQSVDPSTSANAPTLLPNADSTSGAQPIDNAPPPTTAAVPEQQPESIQPHTTILSSAATPQQAGPSTTDSLAPTPAPPNPLTAPSLQEQALRTLLTLDAFPQLENLPAQPTIPPTTSTSRSSKPIPQTSILSTILLPDAHPPLTPAEQKYLTSRSLKKKGDNFLPDRPAKTACCITAKEARFRDPKTGLGYRDLAAYKSLQRALAGGCAWSGLEDCWVGIVGDGGLGRVAKDVPEGFWSGVVKEVEVVKIEDDGEQVVGQKKKIDTLDQGQAKV